MNESIMITADDREVIFDGELIKQATSSVKVTESDERSFTTSVYAVIDGGFAVVIELRSSNSGIPDVVEAELVDTVDDVDAILCLFEPMTHIRLDRQLVNEGKKKVERCVANAFFQSADQIAQAARDYLDGHPHCEFLKPINPVPSSSRIWKLLGMGS